MKFQQAATPDDQHPLMMQVNNPCITAVSHISAQQAMNWRTAKLGIRILLNILDSKPGVGPNYPPVLQVSKLNTVRE